MDDCIFCQIVAGKIPCYKVYEDSDYLGFLDIKPKSVGHCLVIPKKHYRWVYDVPEFGQYFEIAQKIIKKLSKTTKADSIMIMTVGEEIHHAHIQLIPQYFATPLLSNLNLQEITDRINS